MSRKEILQREQDEETRRDLMRNLASLTKEYAVLLKSFNDLYEMTKPIIKFQIEKLIDKNQTEELSR